MPSEAIGPRLTLRFVREASLELRATEFHLPKTANGPVTMKCSEGKAGDATFEWRAGTQALCLCLVRFLCCPKDQLAKGVKFVFEGNCEHAAKTVDNVLAKSNNANCWQQSMFGAYGDGSCRLKRFVKRRNPGGRDKNRHYELEVQHEEFPQDALTIEINGQPVTEIRALDRLADEIEDQWFAGQPLYKKQWGKVKKARKQRVDVLTVGPLQAERKSFCSSVGIGTEMLETPQSTQALKPLAELFKTLSVPSIKSHITAALLPARGREAIEKSLAELLSPECVNVVAEKLASESIDDFCDFYSSDYDSPPDIKSSIATVIATNPEIRGKLAAKVATCGYRDMSGWFQAFSFFCAREIVLDVEHALLTVAESPDFAEKFEIYAPGRLPSLIEHFSRYGCVSAVRIFQKMCEQESERDRKLASLIE